MKKILLSVLLSFVVFAQSRAMEEHQSVIEILEKVPGFEEHFDKYFSQDYRFKLNNWYKGCSEKTEEIPSLFKLICPDKESSIPKIFKEGAPLRFPLDLVNSLKCCGMFIQTFLSCQVLFLRGAIDAIKLISEESDEEFTMDVLRNSLMNSCSICSKIAVGKKEPKKIGTIGDYLLFRGPIETYNAVVEYLIKRYNFRDPRTGGKS